MPTFYRSPRAQPASGFKPRRPPAPRTPPPDPTRVHRERHLLTGETVPASTQPTEIKLVTFAPQKWLLVDMESGEVWRPDDRGSLRDAKGALRPRFGHMLKAKPGARLLALTRD